MWAQLRRPNSYQYTHVLWRKWLAKVMSQLIL
jgi:hypothetical protein